MFRSFAYMLKNEYICLACDFLNEWQSSTIFTFLILHMCPLQSRTYFKNYNHYVVSWVGASMERRIWHRASRALKWQFKSTSNSRGQGPLRYHPVSSAGCLFKSSIELWHFTLNMPAKQRIFFLDATELSFNFTADTLITFLPRNRLGPKPSPPQTYQRSHMGVGFDPWGFKGADLSQEFQPKSYEGKYQISSFKSRHVTQTLPFISCGGHKSIELNEL